jgi:hypothetical protein
MIHSNQAIEKQKQFKKKKIFLQWRSEEFSSSGQLKNLVDNRFLKTYSHFKSQYLLKRNSSPATNRQVRWLSLYSLTNVFFIDMSETSRFWSRPRSEKNFGAGPGHGGTRTTSPISNFSELGNCRRRIKIGGQ